MKKVAGFFKALSIALPILGIALIVIGFLSISNSDSSIVGPCLIFGFAFIFIGAICGAIRKIISYRINGGLIGSVANMVDKIRDSINNRNSDDTEAEVNDEIKSGSAKKQITCAYCGITYNKDAGSCPGCGANNK